MEKDMPGIWYWQMASTIIWTRPGEMLLTAKQKKAPENVRIPSINYDYFLVTTQELEKTHQLDESIPLPECMADADNYYVHEGLYLDTYNEDQIKWIFEKAPAESDRIYYNEMQ